MISLRAGSATSVGQVRNNNQDSYLVAPEHHLFGVADGIGGNQGGEVASAMAVDIIADLATERNPENLLEATVTANRRIFGRSASSPELHGMGTTFVGVQLMSGDDEDGLDDELCWINIGDSRIYLFRDGEIIQLSEDHSLVEQLVREGRISEEEARVHPQRNIITRSLGVDLDVRADLGTVAPVTGDRLLLCSDGLTNEVPDDRIASVLRRLSDPAEAAAELVRLANENGGRDNITVVVVDVDDDGGRAVAASEALADEPLMASSFPPIQTISVDEDGDFHEVPRPENPPEPDPETAELPGVPDEPDEAVEAVEPPRTKRVTWRVVAFAVALLAIVGATIAGVGLVARNSWYVGFDDADRIALYRGRPGGILFFDPEVVETTDLTRDRVAALYRDDLEDGKPFGSESAAQRYLENLRNASRADLDPSNDGSGGTTDPGPDDPTATTEATDGSTTSTAPVDTTTVPATTTPER